MKIMKKLFTFIIAAISLAAVFWIGSFYWKNLRGISPALKKPPADITQVINTVGMPLTLRADFSINIFAKDLGKPRVLALDQNGTILVSIPSQRKVVAMPDKNGDGIADETKTVIAELNQPHGLAFHCPTSPQNQCQLFIAESNQVAVYDYDAQNYTATNKRKILDLPDGGMHVTRTILVLPSPAGDKLLISVGSDCNVCQEDDWRRAKILVSNLDGSDFKKYATGLRNSVFMALHPNTGQVWATEMGRDLLGDDLPPDEINIIEEGKNYGWPNCYGKNIHDADFDKKTYIRNPCDEPFETGSHIEIPAHSAPLGLAFLNNDLLVSYHGSWNRSEPTGYKIVRYFLDENGALRGTEDFITGWLRKDGALGRPVDILVGPNEDITFISDDKAGVIYRVKKV